ncbi:MAG: hypothetical protein IJ831_06810 [Spirochaetales bacterium]|nr:hypothetical protein [Spirochaetales bacterium]
MSISLPILSRDEVMKVIPHKSSMALIDSIFSYRDKELEAGATLSDLSPFFNGENTPGYVCFELIAQSISAYSFFKGYRNGERPLMGFILKVSDFRISRPFLEKDAKVRILVREDFELASDLYNFVGEVRESGELVAEGKLMVMCAENLDMVQTGENA